MANSFRNIEIFISVIREHVILRETDVLSKKIIVKSYITSYYPVEKELLSDRNRIAIPYLC